jgi:hypothetical protein
MHRLYAAFTPCFENYVRWAWCIASAIPLMAWFDGASHWALAASLNAFVVVFVLSNND